MSAKRTPKHAAARPAATPHGARRANSEVQRTRATQLYLAGHTPVAVAEQLAIPPRTARHWLKQTRKEFAEDHRAERDQMLVRAIESQRAIAAAAFASYEEERERERAILAGKHDYVKRRVVRRGRPRRAGRMGDLGEGDESDDPGDLIEEIERPRLPNQSARFLTLALAAQREIARLQGAYDAHLAQSAGPEHLLVADDIDPETGEPIIVPFDEKYPFDEPDATDDPGDPDLDEHARGAHQPATNGNTADLTPATAPSAPCAPENQTNASDAATNGNSAIGAPPISAACTAPSAGHAPPNIPA